ncbi:MAG: diaminopimelate decarboxylase [Clostridia bacterium]|nr:diaminopimelate decarboxylase [Clostridia bacterium]
MLYPYLSTNENGHLTIAGHDTVSLAQKYGTALFVLNVDRLQENCRIYVDTLRECFGDNAMPLFASKSLSFTGIYTLMNRFGMGTDIVSCGELYTAKKAGFPLEKAFFHGNNKTDSDIAYALDNKIGYFVVDNEDELLRLSAIAKEYGITQKILLRITPGIDPHTHKAIVTGSVDSKFGKAIETNQAYEIVELALALDNIELCGFHCHIGSQIFECQPFCDASDCMLAFIHEVKKRYHYEAKMLNLGGGFGVRYVESDPEVNIADNIRAVAAHVKTKCQEYGLSLPYILMEPGRSIVADTTVTLYTVGSVKEITGFRNYVSVDGGMTDNPRYALYQSAYTVLTANRMNEEADYACTVAGRCCESGDLIQENVMIAKPERGDILAVLTTGAYNYSMASNYNRLPRPAILLVGNNYEKLAVRRESFEDLCRLDLDL